MALDPLQFQPPLGNLQPGMFPNEDLSARLQGYITEAAIQVAAVPPALQDQAATAWVYYRAYSALHAALLAAPSSLTLSDQGSASYSDQQLRDIRDLAAAYRAEFEGLIPAAVAETFAPPSGATRNEVNFT